jgi:hypothetical protein
MSCCGCPIACVPITDEAARPYAHTEIHTADGVWIKSMVIPRAMTVLPQHAHVHDHTTLVTNGSVRVWQDGKELGDFEAPAGIFIRAGVKHLFVTLEDGTVIYCIHNIARSGVVEIAEEHQVEAH